MAAAGIPVTIAAAAAAVVWVTGSDGGHGDGDSDGGGSGGGGGGDKISMCIGLEWWKISGGERFFSVYLRHLHGYIRGSKIYVDGGLFDL